MTEESDFNEDNNVPPEDEGEFFRCPGCGESCFAIYKTRTRTWRFPEKPDEVFYDYEPVAECLHCEGVTLVRHLMIAYDRLER